MNKEIINYEEKYFELKEKYRELQKMYKDLIKRYDKQHAQLLNYMVVYGAYVDNGIKKC